MVAVRLPEPLSGYTPIDLGALRGFGAGMLAVAAVRPVVPFEFVPPCPLRTLTGIPCPLCGMTRGVTAAVHGNLAHAAFLNPGSVAVVAAAVLLLLAWRTKRIHVPVWLVALILGLLWSWQLFKYATGRPL
jgi:Protein of unknown function (DUF2752)